MSILFSEETRAFEGKQLEKDRLSTILATMPEMKMRRAYSYIRFSSTKQEKGDSIRRQTDLRTAVLKDHPDWELDDTPLEDLGVSGWSGANITEGALGTFIAAVEADKIPRGSVLIIEQWDRLTRLPAIEAMELFSRITRRGIDVCTAVDKKVHNRESMRDIGNLLESIIKMTLANDESQKKSERVREAFAEKRNSGKVFTSVCPGWLRWVGEKFEVIPERAAIVNEIFHLTLAGHGRMAVCNILNARKEPCFGERNLSGWWSSYVSRLLHNPAVIGRFQPCIHLKDDKGKVTRVPEGEPRQNYYPPIIAISLWQQVQKQIADCKKVLRGAGNPKAGRPSLIPLRNLFPGLLYDGYHQESKMRLSGGNDGFVSDWHRLNPNSGEKRVHWNKRNFEKTVLKYLRELDYKGLIATPAMPTPEEIRLAEAQTKLDDITKRANQIMDKLESCEDKEQQALLMQRLRERAKEKTKLEADVEKLTSASETARVAVASMSEAQDAIRKLRAAEDVESRLKLRSEIRRLVARIDLFPHGYNESGFPSDPFFQITFRDGGVREVTGEGVVFEMDGASMAKLSNALAKLPQSGLILAP